MNAVLLRLGFSPSEFDKCFYYKIEGKIRNFVLLFVDDLLVACENSELVKRIFEEMTKEFEGLSIQEGESISYLGFNIKQGPEGITLDQSGYISKMLKSLNLTKTPKYKNPFASDFKLNQDRYLLPTDNANPKTLWMMKHLNN